MHKKRLQKPKVPVLQVIIFGIGVALLAIINSCGYGGLRIANAVPPKTKKIVHYLLRGSLDTAVLTSQMHEQHKLKLALSSKEFEGPVDVRISSPQLARLDIRKNIKISASPATLTVTRGTVSEITISIDVGAAAPVLDETQLRIEVVKAGTREVLYRTEMDLNVLPALAVSN